MGSDKFDGNAIQRQMVSIHAPTWGATEHKDLKREEITVSIHAPTWGATATAEEITTKDKGFNPRSHMGSDAKFPDDVLQPDVSIHAPTWGATLLDFLGG